MKQYFLLLSLLLLGCFCFADGSTTTTLVNLGAPSAQDLESFVSTLVSTKVAGILAGVAGLVQLMMFVIKLKFVDLGKFNLLIVMGLSTIFGVLILHINGISWMDALVHSQTIWAFQVLGHQIKTQFFDKEDNGPSLAKPSN